MTPPATGISEEENLAGDGDIHKVYLTFEDGPSDHTGEILDILAQYDVKATFLWSGKRMKNPRHCIRESQMRTYARHAFLFQQIQPDLSVR